MDTTKPTSTANRSGLFALILTGNALAPKLCHGDTVVIDPHRKARPGDALLVSLDGNAAVRAVMLLNADGDLTDCRAGFVPRGCFEIVGVVVAVRPVGKATATETRREPVRRIRRLPSKSHKNDKNHGTRRVRDGGHRLPFLSALVAALLGQAGNIVLRPAEREAAARVIATATAHDMTIARRMLASAHEFIAQRQA